MAQSFFVFNVNYSATCHKTQNGYQQREKATLKNTH